MWDKFPGGGVFGMVIRSRIVAVVAVAMLALPFNVAQAQSMQSEASANAQNDAVIAQQKAAAQQAQILANTNNDLARCRLAAQGQWPVPGNIAFSQSAPANLVNACTPSMGTTGGATPTNSVTPGTPGCVSPLSAFQQNQINDWAVAVAKAHSNKTAEPAMPPEVVALIGAC
jgi:hypothetical protein